MQPKMTPTNSKVIPPKRAGAMINVINIKAECRKSRILGKTCKRPNNPGKVILSTGIELDKGEGEKCLGTVKVTISIVPIARPKPIHIATGQNNKAVQKLSVSSDFMTVLSLTGKANFLPLKIRFRKLIFPFLAFNSSLTQNLTIGILP